jgi:hypothetical protein
MTRKNSVPTFNLLKRPKTDFLALSVGEDGASSVVPKYGIV